MTANRLSDVVIAHGTGPGHDLPIPLFYAISAGALAVFASFAAVSLLWPESRLRGARAGIAVPIAVQRAADARVTRLLLRVVGIAVVTFTVIEAIRLPDDSHVNPVPSIVYGVFWVGLAVLSLVFGPVWRLINPLRTIHEATSRASGRDPKTGRRPLPSWLGYWPAALGLLAFTWMELVSPEPSSTRTLLTFFVVYSAVQLVAATVFGSRWFDQGDAFEVFSGLIGRLAFIGRRVDRRVVVRNPLNGLDAIKAGPGLAAAVCVLLASTGFDSVTTFWDYPSDMAGAVGLMAAVSALYVLYLLCAPRPSLLAHTLVPIAVGYLIAHYITYLIGESQRAFVLSTGADWSINEAPLPSGLVATIQVLAIVTGHVLGVVAAHDRAVRVLEPLRAVAGQVPMMVLMVCLTIGGLTLLSLG
jgi:hypothetical protein